MTRASTQRSLSDVELKAKRAALMIAEIVTDKKESSRVRLMAAWAVSEALMNGRRGHVCGLPEIGTYSGQVILSPPDYLKQKWPNGIGIDVCLALEIQTLWRAGIKTSGHCCGHGRANPMINVFPESVQAMKAMGYQVQSNPMRPGAEDTFWPKTRFVQEDSA